MLDSRAGVPCERRNWRGFAFFVETDYLLLSVCLISCELVVWLSVVEDGPQLDMHKIFNYQIEGFM